MNVTLQADYGTGNLFYKYFQPTFFDEPTNPKKRKGKFCKVYNDGGHYIAIPLEYTGKKRDRQQPTDEVKTAREMFDSLYALAVADGKDKAETRAFLQDNLTAFFDSDTALNDFIEDNVKRRMNNYFSRRKRAKRKGNLNRWHYFVTFTYDEDKVINKDGKKQTETDFRARLRRCLSNLHTRRGWRYMGVFERAPETGRLHFHGLFYIPENEMIGEITEKQDYSTKQHKMQTTHENSFFLDKFGRNDFEDIRAFEHQNGNAVNYILKYIEKTGERVTYSRGIPAEIYTRIEKKDVICEMRDFVLKYVLFDDVIDWESDIKHYTAPTVKGYEPVYLC